MSSTLQSPRVKKSNEDTDALIERFGSTRKSRFSRHVILCVIGLVMMYPLLWLVSSSLKPNGLIFSDLSLWPAEWSPSNYTEGWNALEYDFGIYFSNSIIIVVLSIVGNLFSCSLAAYGFARLNFTGRKLFFALMLGTMMLPGHVLLIPQYVIFQKAGLVNTYVPLLLGKFLAVDAFFVFLIVQFMRGLPKELDEAARIDGAGHARIFFYIVLPLCRPALITSAIFAFIWSWNDFLSPLLYLNDASKYPLSLGLKLFIDQDTLADYGGMMAMSLLALVPVLLFFLAFQRFLVEGAEV